MTLDTTKSSKKPCLSAASSNTSSTPELDNGKNWPKSQKDKDQLLTLYNAASP